MKKQRTMGDIEFACDNVLGELLAMVWCFVWYIVTI